MKNYLNTVRFQSEKIIAGEYENKVLQELNGLEGVEGWGWILWMLITTRNWSPLTLSKKHCQRLHSIFRNYLPNAVADFLAA